MHTYTTILHRTLWAALLLTGLSACNKLLEIPPPNEIGIDEAFNDSASAVAAISGIYSSMLSHGNFEWSGLGFQAARSADEAMCHTGTDYFANDSLLYTDADVSNMWIQGFNSLLMINTCISGLQPATRLSPALHNQLLGEALFCRAFVNFYLVNCFGDALPLVTTPDAQANQRAKSVPRQQVYDQIMADLLKAQELMTSTYPATNRVRPNGMAANALLARVYLYQHRYADAITQASAVIGSNLYSPLPDLTSVFLKDSPETIWQLMPITMNGVTFSVADVDLYQRTPTSLHPQLLAAFEPGDLRQLYWTVSNTISGTTYITANKYRNEARFGNTTHIEYYIVLRLAEQYLIRAEGYARLGQTQAAIADINQIRARAVMPHLPDTLHAQQCIQAVEHERQIELFTEWGHRWFDLKRWPGINDPHVTRADEVLGNSKRDWQPTDQWYPVPKAVLQNNQYLEQNPGYPIK